MKGPEEKTYRCLGCLRFCARVKRSTPGDQEFRLVYESHVGSQILWGA